MRPLRYSINVTLDGCCDHRAILADEDLHRHAVENLDQADALLFGRVTYEMMEAAFRPPARTGARPDWMEPFARTIDAAKKYVVSSTLERVDWNAELVRGDLGKAVQQLKRESGKGLLVGGVQLPLALAELGVSQTAKESECSNSGQAASAATPICRPRPRKRSFALLSARSALPAPNLSWGSSARTAAVNSCGARHALVNCCASTPHQLHESSNRRAANHVWRSNHALQPTPSRCAHGAAERGL